MSNDCPSSPLSTVSSVISFFGDNDNNEEPVVQEEEEKEPVTELCLRCLRRPIVDVGILCPHCRDGFCSDCDRPLQRSATIWCQPCREMITDEMMSDVPQASTIAYRAQLQNCRENGLPVIAEYTRSEYDRSRRIPSSSVQAVAEGASEWVE